MKCWKCGNGMEIPATARILPRDSCPSYDYDLHVCRNCRFHDPHSHNECVETQAEWVRDKEKANHCDYFEPGGACGPGVGHRTATRNAKAAFNRLFKD